MWIFARVSNRNNMPDNPTADILSPIQNCQSTGKKKKQTAEEGDTAGKPSFEFQTLKSKFYLILFMRSYYVPYKYTDYGQSLMKTKPLLNL